MVIFYQSQPIIQDDDLVSIQSFEELLETLEAITSVPISNIKLIANGKILSSANYSAELITSQTKVVMVGSSSSSIPSPDQQEHRVKDDLSEEGMRSQRHRIAADESFDRRMRKKKELANPYRFHELETLSGFDDESHARELLQLLSTDPGVLAVLKKHKWSVGKLCEMYPEGYVGVSDVCILGLNKNKGEEIYLRLRTDDLKGFRKLLTIKKVLYHELAHNEHSDHDDKFYMLMRQIEKEVVSLDWRQNSRGHVLGTGGNVVHAPFLSPPSVPNVTAEDTGKEGTEEKMTDSQALSQDQCQSQDQELSISSVLNDNVESSSVQSCPCGCAASIPQQACQSVTPSNDKVDEPPKELPTSSDSVTNSTEEEMSSLPDSTVDTKTTAERDDDGAAMLIQLVSDRIISSIDETLASYYSLQQEPPERIVQLRQALYGMLLVVGKHARFIDEVRQHSIGQLLETLTLLRDIISRAKESDDPKYRSLNRTKKIFQRVLFETQALPVLFAVGFEVQTDSSDHMHLPAVRSDPAVMYMFVNILNEAIEASKTTLMEYIEAKTLTSSAMVATPQSVGGA